jgi:hypothetical protein
LHISPPSLNSKYFKKFDFYLTFYIYYTIFLYKNQRIGGADRPGHATQGGIGILGKSKMSLELDFWGGLHAHEDSH